MPRTRPLRADVRADVLDAARAVFTELGYHRASLEAIATRAGYSKGAVYSNFAGKDDLFLELVALETSSQVELVTAAIPLGETGLGGADGVLDVFADGLLALARDAYTQLLFAEFRAAASRDAELAARVAQVRQGLLEALATRLEEELARYGLRCVTTAHDAVVTVLALVNGLALEQVGQPDVLPARSTVVAVLDALVTTAAPTRTEEH